MVEHEYAIDTNGEPVNIEIAIPFVRSLYFCPECNSEMVVKNRGKIKEHHFAHYNGTGCTGGKGGNGESPAHSDTILFLLEQFRESIQSNKSFVLHRRCGKYSNIDYISYNILNYGLNTKTPSPFSINSYEFNYNILKDIDQVEREYTIPGSLWRPDLALLSNGKVLRVIEVYYTNEDDPNKTKYYKENKIDVIKIDLMNNPGAFQIIKSNWKYKRLDNTTIYCYSGCNILIRRYMLIENLKTRRLLNNLIPMINELYTIKNEGWYIKSKYSMLLGDYKTLYNDIKNEIRLTTKENEKIKSMYFLKIQELSREFQELKDDYRSLLYDIKCEKLNIMFEPIFSEKTEILNDIASLKKEIDLLQSDYFKLIIDIKNEMHKIINLNVDSVNFETDFVILQNRYPSSKLTSIFKHVLKEIPDRNITGGELVFSFPNQILPEEPSIVKRELILLMRKHKLIKVTPIGVELTI